ncbi:MAG: nucleotide-binding domain-containing protein [Gammaproteobacteria bacterium]
MRDIKGTFTVKSILLTTFLGNQINVFDSLSGDFPDTPTALKKIFGRVDDWLQERPMMPTVTNPVLETEKFNRHWDQAKYENFREKVNQYREWIDDAYAEHDRDVSIQKWRRVFGEDFAKGEVVKKAAIAVALVLRETASTDMVLAVSRLGPGILKRISPHLPHVEAPPWKAARNTLTVVVRASESNTRNGSAVREIASGTIVAKKREIKFRAVQANGLSFPSKDYDVRWQVVNTDTEATKRNQLRGGFYPSDSHGIRWESTLYRGAHWVEAFVILRRIRALSGKSDRFFVVVE